MSCNHSLFFHSAAVRILDVMVLDSTRVRVSWTPVDLPMSVVDHYTVHYTTVDGSSGRRRQSNTQTTFPGTASSGVVPRLVTGQQYQFGVSVTLVDANGRTYTGTVANQSDPVTVQAGGYDYTCVSFQASIQCSPHPHPPPSLPPPPPPLAPGANIGAIVGAIIAVLAILAIIVVGVVVFLLLRLAVSLEYFPCHLCCFPLQALRKVFNIHC